MRELAAVIIAAVLLWILAVWLIFFAVDHLT